MTKLATALKRWRENPVTMVRELFGVEPDWWQIQVLEAFPKNQRAAMKACKGPGKTCVLAWLAWNFMLCYAMKGNHPKVIATSISGPNLADGLWAEMSKWQQRSEMLLDQFTWSKTSIVSKKHPSTWFMVARQWSQSATKDEQAQTLAGKHADYILFILDEAGSIPDSVMVAAEAALASGKVCKLLIAGNPTNLEGPLYRACTTERDLWFLMEITGDPDDPHRSPRVPIEWARQQISKYGRDNPWVLVNVFGKFPPGSIEVLLTPDEVRAAVGRHVSEDKYVFIQPRIGVDVARKGDDRTVISFRQGLAAFHTKELRNAKTEEIISLVLFAQFKFHAEMVYVDGTGGWGAGVVDGLRLAGLGVVEVQFSGKADDPRFLNKRAEMWFRMAEWVKKGGCLPPDPGLEKELTSVQYTFHSGKFQLEDKELTKDRIGFSPDKADSLACTFCNVDLPAATVAREFGGGQTGEAEHEYDPLAGAFGD